jgi:hypothetical protein
VEHAGQPDRQWEGEQMIDVQDCTQVECRTRGDDLRLVLGLEVVALLMWAGYDAAGIDLTVRAGSGVTTVGLGAVAVTTTVVTALAIGLRRLLGRRDDGPQLWGVVAAVVWAVSFVGPLGATTAAAGLALASFHLVVGAGIFLGVRRLDSR